MKQNISKTKAILILEQLKVTKQYFCFPRYDQYITAEDLLSIIRGRKVTYEETVKYLTAPIIH